MPKQELTLRNPITNLPGTLGYYPDLKRYPELASLGAFFTNPISLHKRMPAANRQAGIYHHTLLLHTGMPNPGIRQVIKSYAPRWAESEVPIIPHLWTDQLGDLQRMLELIENCSGVSAVSISISPEHSHQELARWIGQLHCELPLILQVTAHRLPEYADLLAHSNLSGLSMAVRRGYSPTGKINSGEGRLFGPGLIMQTLQTLREVQRNELILFASGGIFNPEHVKACLTAGANAVQLDTVFWMGKTKMILEVFNNDAI